MGCATRAFELTLLVLASGCSASDDVPAPLVSSVTPDHAPPGAVVRVIGDYFCQEPEPLEDPGCAVAGVVQFGTIPGGSAAWTDTEIMVEVPQGLAGPVPLRVVVGGRSSRSITFTGD